MSEDPRYCVSCGLDRLGRKLYQALEAAGIPAERRAFVHSGGCASEVVEWGEGERHRVPLGTALPFALGLALARPELVAIALLGDGEAAGTGGNHLVQAARRGDPVRALIVNNEIVSATGGFPSPTTPRGTRTPATPRGSAGAGLDLCELARVAGAVWVGREVVGAEAPLEALLREFLAAEPFAMLEIRAPCFLLLGAPRGYASSDAMLEALERRAIRGPGAVPRSGGAGEPAVGEDRFTVGRLWPRPPGAGRA